jgi:flagellin-like protein
MSAVTDIVSGQAGITGLETAIILIAFVVVASVLSCTTFSEGSSLSRTKDSRRNTSGTQPAEGAPLPITRTIPLKADHNHFADVN